MKKMIRTALLIGWATTSVQCTDKHQVETDAWQIGADSLLPAWQEGYLDIHLINTGKGESTFYIFPDSTTMLVDAASSLITPEEIAPKPNGSKRPSQWIIHYINKVMPQKGSRRLDYFLLTHYDADHIGGCDVFLPLSANGAYRLNGAAEILDYYQVGTLIDRAYPDYDYPQPLDNEKMMNYRNSALYQREHKGLTIQRFVPGTDSQLALLRNPDKYADFSIRNLAVNGEVWTGEGTSTQKTFPALEGITEENMPTENHLCAAFRLKYGLFDYYAGGDLSFRGRSTYAWKDIEGQVAPLLDSLEVLKANHHGSVDANDTLLLRRTNPEVILIHVWRNIQPRAVTLKRMATLTSADIFATNLNDEYKLEYGDDLSRIKDYNAHIVVRVAPGGKQYYIYTIRDTDLDYKVSGCYGPYFCR